MRVQVSAGQQNLVYVMDSREAWLKRWGERERGTWETKGLGGSQQPSSLVATPRLQILIEPRPCVECQLASDFVRFVANGNRKRRAEGWAPWMNPPKSV